MVLLVALAGCGGGARPARIGVVLPADTSAEFGALRGAMQHVADSLGLALEIDAAAQDAAAQAQTVARFVASRVRAIILVPIAPGGLADALAAADRARVPVFTVGVAAEGGPVVAHVAGDARQGAELAGWYLARRLHGGGNVAVLDAGGAEGGDRLAGLRLALAPFPNLRVVASPVVDPPTREAGHRKAATLLASDQRIDALVGTTGELALGALGAVQEARRQEVVVVAFGGGAEARAALLAGTPLAADIVTDPVVLGRYAVEVAASHLRGNRVMTLVPVRERLVDRDSLIGRRAPVESTAP